MRHVFIIGSKGIPAHYGGFETFVDMLVTSRVSQDILYHVACAVDELPANPEYEYHGAHCFCVKWRKIGSARAISYDLDALRWVLGYIERNGIEQPIVYILACRIGPFLGRYAKRIHAIGGMVFVNPDGHEWLRSKWSRPVRMYWKLSERGMVSHADLLVCDSKNIESYILKEYSAYDPKTVYISYGADSEHSVLADDDSAFAAWLEAARLQIGEYYLVVGRFVPENNYETMIREFMASGSSRNLALVTEVADAFMAELEERTGMLMDPRIRFVGAVYDRELLKKIRENAFAYLHGHEVGGTNPSLLEALASTKVNLLLDVGFNREVAGDAALYWSKGEGDLARLIERAESLSAEEVRAYGDASIRAIRERYTWSYITSLYEILFES